MSTKHKYYSHRQVVSMPLVSEGEYTEQILLCIPAFAWRVARAFLSRQAQWESTYAASFQGNYYVSPDEETMDKIKASIDGALAEDDMSCDLEAAIESLGNLLAAQLESNGDDLVNVISDLVSKDCPTACGGSGSAGMAEAEPVDFEDTGENFPDEFPSRAVFDAWKCSVAGLIVDYLLTDLRWFQNTDVTAITAALLVATLLTPVPGDEIAVMVGGAAVMVAEGILDTVLDNIISQLEDDRADLVCGLYNAIDVSTAEAVLTNWADAAFDWAEEHFLSWLINVDAMNWLFTRPNLLLTDEDCSGCTEPTYSDWAVDFGTLTDGSLAGNTTYFEITSAWNTAAGCGRWQCQFTCPPEADFSVSLVKAGPGAPVECPGSPLPIHAHYMDAPTYDYVYRRATDPIEGETLCLVGESTCWSRYDAQYIMQVTVNGVCNE